MSEQENVKSSPQKGDLRVWWIPQVPMKPFYVYVKDINEAKLIIDTLAKYDTFQYENNIKPDFCNAGGLCMFDPDDIEQGEEESGWTDWYDVETGFDFNDYLRFME